MKTHLITKDQLDSENKYIGATDITAFEGNIEIEVNLGYVVFSALKAVGYILAKAGSGIKAGWGIEAGEGIKAGWGIEAGEGIKAGSGIKAGWGIEAGSGIEAKLRIFAGLIMWRLPNPEELKITCKKLESGTIAFGELIETGKAEPKI